MLAGKVKIGEIFVLLYFMFQGTILGENEPDQSEEERRELNAVIVATAFCL